MRASLGAIMIGLAISTGGAALAQPGTISFTITDVTDSAEVGEDTAVFINGTLAAHFVLNANHPNDTITVTIPVAPKYDYALCGRITIRTPEGITETHVLDDGATLLNPAGQHLEALATNNFHSFYLGFRNVGEPLDMHKTNACSIPIS